MKRRIEDKDWPKPIFLGVTFRISIVSAVGRQAYRVSLFIRYNQISDPRYNYLIYLWRHRNVNVYTKGFNGLNTLHDLKLNIRLLDIFVTLSILVYGPLFVSVCVCTRFFLGNYGHKRLTEYINKLDL